MAAVRWAKTLRQRLPLLTGTACRPRGVPLQSRTLWLQRCAAQAAPAGSSSDGEASVVLWCAAAGAAAMALASTNDSRTTANCYYESTPAGQPDRLKRWRRIYWNLPSGTSPSFHHTEVNPYLEKHLDRWSKGIAPEGGRSPSVLVPLCGKSVDMPYLCELGYGVVGVEGVQRAVLEFKAEHQIRVKGMKSKVMMTKDEQGWREGVSFRPAAQFAGSRLGYAYKTGDQGLGYYSESPAVWKGKVNLGKKQAPLNIVEGDMFEVTPELIAASTFVKDGRFDLIFDCDALVSLPPDSWKQYADGLSALLRAGGRVLLVAVQYDQSKLPFKSKQANPPPFSVSKETVCRLFPEYCWSVTVLETEPCGEEFASRCPSFEKSGVSARKVVYLLEKKAEGSAGSRSALTWVAGAATVVGSVAACVFMRPGS